MPLCAIKRGQTLTIKTSVMLNKCYNKFSKTKQYSIYVPRVDLDAQKTYYLSEQQGSILGDVPYTQFSYGAIHTEIVNSINEHNIIIKYNVLSP